MLLAFAKSGLDSSVVSQETGWEERLRNDLFCVERDVKLLHSINRFNGFISGATVAPD